MSAVLQPDTLVPCRKWRELQKRQVATEAQPLVAEVEALISFCAGVRVQAEGHAVLGLPCSMEDRCSTSTVDASVCGCCNRCRLASCSVVQHYSIYMCRNQHPCRCQTRRRQHSGNSRMQMPLISTDTPQSNTAHLLYSTAQQLIMLLLSMSAPRKYDNTAAHIVLLLGRTQHLPSVVQHWPAPCWLVLQESFCGAAATY
jgi:hypothetical protein